MSSANEIEVAAAAIQKRINEWTEVRCEKFIEMLLKSGDVFMVSGPSRIVTENDLDQNTKMNISAQNLFCYQPFHLAEKYRQEISELRAALQSLMGHNNNCYCEKCKELSNKYWNPK